MSNPIHKSVQEHYGAIARQLNVVQPQTSCCTPQSAASTDCGCNSKLYDASLLEGLPVDVTGLSLGCGDPVTIADLKPGETVVDLGSGGGIDCFLAARQVGDSGHVIGVDMTPDMLARANASKAKMGATNVEFREGTIENLPVADNTVDVVMSNCVINLSPDKPSVFHEIFRILKPGGRISVSDIVTEGEFSDDMRANALQWAACVSGAIDGELYAAGLRQAGFVDVQIVDKVEETSDTERQPGAPRIFSARITAHKPA